MAGEDLWAEAQAYSNTLWNPQSDPAVNWLGGSYKYPFQGDPYSGFLLPDAGQPAELNIDTSPSNVATKTNWKNNPAASSSSSSTPLVGFSNDQSGPAMDAYLDALGKFASGGGGGGGVGGDSTGPLRAMRQRIDAEYAGLLGRLDEMYQLAETDQERAMIEFALADLDDQYQTAVTSIGMVFDQADEQAGAYADRAGERAAGVGDEVRAQYEAGVQRNLEQEAMARALLGEQFGDAYRGANTSGAMSALQTDLTNMQSDREGNYRQEMADLSAEDAEWIVANLGSQRAANTAEAGRLQATLRNRAVQEHQRAVQARINAERMARAAAEQQLIQSQMAALSQLAQQESSLRQSDINSRRSAAAAGASASAARQQAQIEALGKLAELEGQKGLSLSALDVPNTNPYGIPTSALRNDLLNLQRSIFADRSRVNEHLGNFVSSATSGLEGAVLGDATEWLYDLVSPWDIVGGGNYGAPSTSGGMAKRYA